MSVQFLVLDGSELEAAILLAQEQSVHVSARREELVRLRRAGFVEAPVAIECFVRTPFLLEQYPRRYRKKLRRSLTEWELANLRIELMTIANFGIERFVEEVYFPIFVRIMYGKGIAPHRAHELDAIMELLRDDAVVATVRNRDGELCGAALLHPGKHDGARHVLRGELPFGLWEEGLIYGLRDGLAGCRRAFMVKLAEAMGDAGRNWLSLGRDLVYCDDGYDGVFFEKLHIAESIVAILGDEHAMFSWRPRTGERFIFFEWDSSGARLLPRNYGCESAQFDPIAALLVPEPSTSMDR
ncbi:hypothetical protein LZC95_43295 [Pendulispora brunnea]|uniref:N-acetyltransferase domain-containing protein n=1 Tax=Pendulispora brunnea TaxID=2905690 RepID=A0ABZ2K3Q8_9BACT